MLTPKSNFNLFVVFFVSVLFFGAVEKIKAQTTSEKDTSNQGFNKDRKSDSIEKEYKKYLKSFSGHKRAIHDSKISPNGKWLATASSDDTILNNLMTGEKKNYSTGW